MEKIGISCICPTYARVDTLEELIYSFINQEYEGESELIIVNDYPLQYLVFDHPKVKIFNIASPFKTIGEKINFCIEQTSFDIIATFDDDDIALPNHLTNISKYMKEGSPILHWAKGVYWNEPEITDITWIGNSGMVYWKEAWEAVKRIPLENAGYDTTFVSKLQSLNTPTFASPEDDEVSWFYRWKFIPGGKITRIGVYHQSGNGSDDEIKPNVLERHSVFIEERREAGFIPTGEIILNPRWHYDYLQQLKEFNNNKNL